MKITIFTPTYNRAHTLRRLYDSLCRQTSMDFEWLVVDDGSGDGTPGLFRELPPAPFPVRYIRQENGGKHRAVNRGVREAAGAWFFIADSDDYLRDDAVEEAAAAIDGIAGRPEFCGVVFNCCYGNGRVVGTTPAYEVLDTDFLSYRSRYRVKGDRAEIVRTSVMREFPFPEFEGEKFCPEGAVWYRMARKYKARYVNRNIYVCDYLEDGLTQNIDNIRRKSPIGCSFCEKERFLHSPSLRQKLLAFGEFWRIYAHVPEGQTAVRPGLLLRLLYPLYPVYLILYRLNRKRQKQKP